MSLRQLLKEAKAMVDYSAKNTKVVKIPASIKDVICVRHVK